MDGEVKVTVSEFVALFNQTMEYAYPSITITGELANFRVSKNRWVYFDLKDELSSVKFFGTVYQLPGPLEDGMLMNVRGVPRLHNLYGFSVNVVSMQPAGEGAIRKAAELLTAKLTAEGLFDESRKRPLPYPPERIGLITSAQSAAYADFMKILGARWGGMAIELVDVQVQGESAPAQIVAAIERFNELSNPPEVLVLTRGGGSADDLAAFSTEQVTRAVAASRVPTLVAIGHEVDISLAELAADRRASTPSNAAEMLTPDRQVALRTLLSTKQEITELVQEQLHDEGTLLEERVRRLHDAIAEDIQARREQLGTRRQLLEVLSPAAALRRGYAVVRHHDKLVRSVTELNTDDIVNIAVMDGEAIARITDIRTDHPHA